MSPGRFQPYFRFHSCCQFVACPEPESYRPSAWHDGRRRLMRRRSGSNGAIDGRNVLRDLILCKAGDVVVGEHAVVDAELVDVAAAIVAVRAFNAGGADDARVRAELIERGVKEAGGFLGRHQLAVDVKTNAAGLVPRQSEVHPLVGLGHLRQLDGDARAAQVHVGDESVEAVAVPVDAQPHHVPTGVVSKAHAEDGKFGFVKRMRERQKNESVPRCE